MRSCPDVPTDRGVEVALVERQGPGEVEPADP